MSDSGKNQNVLTCNHIHELHNSDDNTCTKGKISVNVEFCHFISELVFIDACVVVF